MEAAVERRGLGAQHSNRDTKQPEPASGPEAEQFLYERLELFTAGTRFDELPFLIEDEHRGDAADVIHAAILVPTNSRPITDLNTGSPMINRPYQLAMISELCR